MIPSGQLLLVGIVLALAGAAKVLVDARRTGESSQFVSYLIGLLLALSGVGLVLAATL